jgi:uncharacterized protein YecT (DUF1311 family)
MRSISAVLVVMMTGLFWASAQDEGPTLAEATAEFQKHDRALNVIYAELRKDLEELEFESVKKDQREWLDYRDYISEGQARRVDDFKQSADYWEMAAEMTESRSRYLKAWRGIGDQGDWTGEYTDGRGGSLEIVETKAGIYFVLLVVRGPSFHFGVMGGLAKTNESMARFSIPIEDSDEDSEEECWISFLNDREDDGRIEVITANSHGFHGARAYFDNTYLRVSLLDQAAQAKVIKTAKAGGLLE